MTERIDVEHRRALLVDRQMLGAASRTERSLSNVAERLALLHATDPSTPYLTIHARAEVSPTDIDRALYDDRNLLRVTTLRRTVFVMPLGVAGLATSAYNTAMTAKLRRQLEIWIAENSDDVDVVDRDEARSFLVGVERDVIVHLEREGPTTGSDLADAIAELRVRFDPMPGKSYSRPLRITSKVLEILAAEASIVRGRPTGDLTSGAWTWTAMADWSDDGLARLEPADALAELMRRYLSAFGPATVTDATWWTGLTKTKVRAAFDTIGAREVTVEGSPEPGWVLAHDGLESAECDGPSVALLPGLDSTTMGWKQRDWYVDDDVATGLFDRNGNAGPTVWVDGRVVGGWTQRSDGEIAVEVVDQVGADIDSMIGDEADRIATWLSDVRVNWRFPTPMTKRLES